MGVSPELEVHREKVESMKGVQETSLKQARAVQSKMNQACKCNLTKQTARLNLIQNSRAKRRNHGRWLQKKKTKT